MAWIRVPTKQVRDIVAKTFPDYRRKEVAIVPTTSVTLSDLNWSGGTRAEYRALNLITGEASGATTFMSAPPPWANQYEGLRVPLQPGQMIIEGGHFCGKPATLKIHVHPDNMPKLLTA